jgi:hypothetical protein
MIIAHSKINLLKNNAKITGRKDMNPNNKKIRINSNHEVNNRTSKMAQNNLERLK